MPSHYNVFVDVFMRTKKVVGNVTIDIKVVSNIKYVILHALDFTTLSGSLFNESGEEVILKRQFEYKKNQYYILEPVKELSAGAYYLKFDFIYTLKTKLVGFYQATYKSEKGEEK